MSYSATQPQCQTQPQNTVQQAALGYLSPGIVLASPLTDADKADYLGALNDLNVHLSDPHLSVEDMLGVLEQWRQLSEHFYKRVAVEGELFDAHKHQDEVAALISSLKAVNLEERQKEEQENGPSGEQQSKVDFMLEALTSLQNLSLISEGDLEEDLEGEALFEELCEKYDGRGGCV